MFCSWHKKKHYTEEERRREWKSKKTIYKLNFYSFTFLFKSVHTVCMRFLFLFLFFFHSFLNFIESCVQVSVHFLTRWILVWWYTEYALLGQGFCALIMKLNVLKKKKKKKWLWLCIEHKIEMDLYTYRVLWCQCECILHIKFIFASSTSFIIFFTYRYIIILILLSHCCNGSEENCAYTHTVY